MGDVFAFWAVVLIIGASAMPVAFTVFRRFPDGGAGLAAPLGLLLAGYAYFILRTIGVVPQGRGGYLLVIVLLAAGGLAIAGRDRRFRTTARRSWPGAVIALGLFTLAFFAYVTFRSYNSEIQGTEQPMDFMYLNATLESPDYPPRDPWLAGERASYYYYGYLQVGVLTGASGAPPSVGYNLGLAYTFAAGATAIASLAGALARWILGPRGRRWAIGAAGLAPVMLLGVGSLSAIFEWAAAHGHTNLSLFRLFGVEWMVPCAPGATDNCYTGPLSPRTTEWYPTEYWFWWRGSRIIPDTITEFPFFSFLLGDLHPHVMAIPLVFLAVGLAVATGRGRTALSLWTHRNEPLPGLLAAVVLGALAFQNAWDLLTFSAVYAVLVLVRNLRRSPLLIAIRASAGYLAPIAILAVALYIPWYLTFSSQASGIYPYVGEGTRPAHAFLQFGPLLLASLIGLAWCFRRADWPQFGRSASYTLWLPLVPVFAWSAFAGYRGEYTNAVDTRGTGGWVTLALYGTGTWLFATAFVALALRRRPAAPVLGFAAVAALLLYGAELFFIGDVFRGLIPRQNTVFKLTYQAWMLLSLAGSVALVVAVREGWRRRPNPNWLAAPVALLVLGGLAYPLLAIPNRTDNFDGEHSSIDGLAFLARSDPAEYALQRWVREQTAPGDVIIEASGRTWTRDASGKPVVSNPGTDYTDSGRIAARTGRETPVGWYFHEVQWRGDTPEVHALLSKRQELVDGIYLATDGAAAIEAMRQAGASYLVVGSIERARYPGDLMARFDTFLELVFDSGDDGFGRSAKVYALPGLGNDN